MKCRHSSIMVILSTLFHIAKSDFFTAVADLDKLLLTKENIIITLEKYIKYEEERLEQLKRAMQRYVKLQEVANKDSESFLSNPVNAFLLVKYLTADWEGCLHLIAASENRETVTKISSEALLFPDENDLLGAATSLMRLQKTYLLDTETVALGHFGVYNLSFDLTASDCFELGKQARKANYTSYALEWFQESLKRLEKENISTVDKLDVLEYIAFTAYDVGNFTYGLRVTEEILSIYHNYPRIFNNVQYYQARKAEWEKMTLPQQSMGPELSIVKKYVLVNGKVWFGSDIVKSYERLCRGETIKTPAKKSKLFCHYTTKNNNYLLLQPVKTEVLSLNPRIVLYHDVIKDSESKIIKDLALPKLERAVVTDTNTGETEITQDRISKSTVLEDVEHEVLTELNRRIEDIAGLGTESAKSFHVINYGIGGHYDPHYDFAQVPENIELFRNKGNRIATWIFYLSDVPAGGSTVFPIAEVEVKPVKGAALFWHNLYQNGKGNMNTLHAGCPVLTGSKWISTKWLHEAGQEFKRPCNLNPSK